jgi:hypothetical protein
MRVRNLITGLALGLALPALATAQTTTTTSSTTTTTSSTTTTSTLPGGCVVEASFTSLSCRSDALTMRLQGATDLGKTKDTLMKQAAKFDALLADAEAQMAAGNRGKAKKRLKSADRVLTSMGFRLRSLNGRRQIADATRSELRATVAGLDADLTALRKTL